MKITYLNVLQCKPLNVIAVNVITDNRFQGSHLLLAIIRPNVITFSGFHCKSFYANNLLYSASQSTNNFPVKRLQLKWIEKKNQLKLSFVIFFYIVGTKYRRVRTQRKIYCLVLWASLQSFSASFQSFPALKHTKVFVVDKKHNTKNYGPFWWTTYVVQQ